MNETLKYARVQFNMNPKMLERLDNHIGRSSRTNWIQVAIEERLAREAPIEGEIPR